MSAIDDGGSMVCPVHGVHTRISCVKCGRPICPKCAVTSPVGLTCGQHQQRSIRFVRWLPARGPVREWSPWIFFPFAGIALTAALRVTALFFVALVPNRPWVGGLVLLALVAAFTVGVLYVARGRG